MNPAANESPAPTLSTMFVISYLVLARDFLRLCRIADHPLLSALWLSRSVITCFSRLGNSFNTFSASREYLSISRVSLSPFPLPPSPFPPPPPPPSPPPLSHPLRLSPY